MCSGFSERLMAVVHPGDDADAGVVQPRDEGGPFLQHLLRVGAEALEHRLDARRWFAHRGVVEAEGRADGDSAVGDAARAALSASPSLARWHRCKCSNQYVRIGRRSFGGVRHDRVVSIALEVGGRGGEQLVVSDRWPWSWSSCSTCVCTCAPIAISASRVEAAHLDLRCSPAADAIHSTLKYGQANDRLRGS